MPITYRSSISPAALNSISVVPSHDSPAPVMMSGSFASNVKQLPASTTDVRSLYPSMGNQNIPLSQRNVRSLPAQIWQSIKELVISIIDCFSSYYACKLRDAWGGALEDKLELSKSLKNISGIISDINKRKNINQLEINRFIERHIITDLSVTTSGYPYELRALKKAIFTLVLHGNKKDFTREFCKAVRADAGYKASYVSQPKSDEYLKAVQKNDSEEALPQDAMKRFLRRAKLLESFFTSFISVSGKGESSRAAPSLDSEQASLRLKKELFSHFRAVERNIKRQDYEDANGVSVLGRPWPTKSTLSTARVSKANIIFDTYYGNTGSIANGNACDKKLLQKGPLNFNAQSWERIIDIVDESEKNVIPSDDQPEDCIIIDQPHEVNFGPKKKPARRSKVQ